MNKKEVGRMTNAATAEISILIVKYTATFLHAVKDYQAGDGYVQPDHIAQKVCGKLRVDKVGLRFILRLLCEAGFCRYSPHSGIILTPEAINFLKNQNYETIEGQVPA